MTLFQQLLIAVVQGVTEFLPISSSGHLILIPYLTNLPDQGPLIDVAVHVGSLLAIIVYFFKDVVVLARGGFASVGIGSSAANAPAERRLFWWIVIGTIPAVLFGLSIKMGAFNGLAENVFGIETGKSRHVVGMGKEIALGIADVCAVEPDITLVEDSVEDDESTATFGRGFDVEVAPVQKGSVVVSEVGVALPVTGNLCHGPLVVVVIETDTVAQQRVVGGRDSPLTREVEGRPAIVRSCIVIGRTHDDDGSGSTVSAPMPPPVGDRIPQEVLSGHGC